MKFQEKLKHLSPEDLGKIVDAIIKKLGGRPPKYDSDYKTKKGRSDIPTQPADETA